jgi:hypothetical protein
LHGATEINRRRKESGLQPGDRCGIPERFALAMQAAGWTYRDDVRWIKRSPMPMSRSGWRWSRCRVKVSSFWTADNPHPSTTGGVNYEPRDGRNAAKWSPCPGCPKCEPNGGLVLRRGRFATTAAHEPIFMFVKGRDYFCDSEAVSEAVADPKRSGSGNKTKRWGNNHTDVRASGTGDVERQSGIPWQNCETRLPRSYLLLSSEPTKEKHFAAYPHRIPRFAIEMATSNAGCCPTCGACHAPIVESVRTATRTGEASKCEGDSDVEGNRDPQRHVASTKVLGYRATCTCPPLPAVPCRVLDPFAGTGTSLRVAKHLGRDWVGIEASADYLPIIEANLERPLPSKDKAKAKPKRTPKPRAEKLLF